MARAMWSGSIAFGLVNVPIKLYPATRDRDIHFHMLSKDGSCRLRRKLYCPETGEEYDFRNTTKGYEIAPDQYVIVTEEELQQLKPKAARTIDIRHFVDLDQIDPVYYDRPYYLAPDEAGTKAYRLLHQAMREARKVGVATFVMRGKEYLAAIRPLENALCLETMRFADEVVSVDELEVPGEVEVDKRQLQAARKLIEVLETEFDPEAYQPEYRQQLVDLIEKKAAGEEIITQAPAPEEAPMVMNLMKALEASVAEARKASGKKPARRRSA